MSKFDKYRTSNKPVSKFAKYRTVDNSVKEEPTWTDRAKEFGQGLAGGIGNMADLASNYVATPVTYLGSKAASGLGKITKYTDRKGAEDYNKLANDLQLLSNKYWNQNANKSFKEADILKTKNKDTTSAMLKGAGEFAPDLLPANLLGKGVRAASTIVHGSTPLVKTAVKGIKNKAIQLFKEPKLPKLANMLEVPLTGSNLAGFAGAGAGHGFAQNEFQDYDKNDIPLYLDLPAIIVGAGVGGGLYGAGKNIGNRIYNTAKGNKNLPISYNRLAKKINSGNNELDEEFIKAAKDSEVGLNPFTIYKNNKEPFIIAKNNPVNEYREVLPKIKHGVYDETNKILDNVFVNYDKNNSKYNANESLKESLTNAYKNAQATATIKYAEAKALMDPTDYLVPNQILSKSKELLKDTDALSHGSSSAGKLNKFLNKFLKEMPSDNKVPLHIINNQRRVINSLQNAKTHGQFNLAKEERDRLQELKHAIDEDLYTSSYKLNTIKNHNWHKNFRGANSYFSENVMPFRDSRVFKKFLKGANYEKIVTNKNANEDLNKLLNIITNQSIVKTKDGLSVPVSDAINANIAQLKKYEVLDQLFSGKNKDKFSMDNLANTIQNSHNNEIFYQNDKNKLGQLKDLKKNKNAADELNHMLPIINKYNELVLKDKKYRSKLSGDYNNPEYYYSKYDVKKHLPHWPTILGGITGAAAGGALGPMNSIGYGIGAASGALLGGSLKQAYSSKIMRAMSDKQFVDELIRLGRLPKKDKEGMLESLTKRPILKTEIIKSLLLKNNEKEPN